MVSIFSQIQQKGDEEEEMMIEFFLLLCSDVILDVLPISAHKIGASWRVFINKLKKFTLLLRRFFALVLNSNPSLFSFLFPLSRLKLEKCKVGKL